jgi:outer membrane receptor for ferrienterochelin and colicins
LPRNILFLFATLLLWVLPSAAQQTTAISGVVADENGPVSDAMVHLKEDGATTLTDSSGHFSFKTVPAGKKTIIIRLIGYDELVQSIPANNTQRPLQFKLQRSDKTIQEVVVTGNLREMKKSESAVPVEIYTSKFFLKNPTPNVFEAMTMVNGVRPQLNCNVCSTGDIHINGMEGPYTMVLIDGMPIVSSLSTVYGLSGIPNSMIERIEVVKGPASSLYGSEAMAGLINIITKNTLRAPLLSADVFATSYGEVNADLGMSFKLKKNISTLVGFNYFNLPVKWDLNKDGFTDVTLQNRFSAFNKWEFRIKEDRNSSLAIRYLYENRWGGQLNWTKDFRGSDSIYGESIYTHRFELIGNTALPVKENIFLQYSYNYHDQNSYYGITPFMAKQHVAFTQLYWDKDWKEQHYLTVGSSFRYVFYDDNTVGTQNIKDSAAYNQPQHTYLPGVFTQYEFRPNEKHRLLLGARYDYNLTHGHIFSPRISYKWSPTKNDILRFNIGNGYRVVNLFTEDHAALSGSREVVISEALKPEQSYNANLNYQRHTNFNKGFITTDVSGFFTYFTNKITGDFDTDPNKIIYNNLKGYAVSAGATLNTEVHFTFPLKISAGLTYNKVYRMDKDTLGRYHKNIQIHAPEWSGTYAVSYTFTKAQLTLDWNGQWSGPMRLPVLPNDFRPEYSPWYCLMNVQATKKFRFGLEIYAGLKNLLNFMPQNPLMRPHDPFDKTAADTQTNPNGYVFDTSYNYAPLQGIRGFVGLRYSFK